MSKLPIGLVDGASEPITGTVAAPLGAERVRRSLGLCSEDASFTDRHCLLTATTSPAFCCSAATASIAFDSSSQRGRAALPRRDGNRTVNGSYDTP